MGKWNAGLTHDEWDRIFESQHRIIKLSEMPSCQSTSLKGHSSTPTVLRDNTDGTIRIRGGLGPLL